MKKFYPIIVTIVFAGAITALILSNMNSDNSNVIVGNFHQKEHEQVQPEIVQVLTHDTSIHLMAGNYDCKILIKVPEGNVTGTLLALHGWNLPASDWCDSTSLCAKALAKGWIVVLPDFGKTIYARNVYPETRKDWQSYPLLPWMTNEMISQLQDEYHLFNTSLKNYAIGLSTGARGALLFALEKPKMFNAIACLSGDYDQSKFPSDNLYRGFYGAQQQFPERWVGEENPIKRIHLLRSALYIGHGAQDDVVPREHSDVLIQQLKEKNPVCNSHYHVDPAAKHNYAYWNSEVDKVFEFFDEY